MKLFLILPLLVSCSIRDLTCERFYCIKQPQARVVCMIGSDNEPHRPSKCIEEP